MPRKVSPPNTTVAIAAEVTDPADSIAAAARDTAIPARVGMSPKTWSRIRSRPTAAEGVALGAAPHTTSRIRWKTSTSFQ